MKWIRNIDENSELNKWRSDHYPNIIPLMQFTNKRLVSEMCQVAEYLNLLYEQGTFTKLIIGYDRHIVQDWEMERMRIFLEDVIGSPDSVIRMIPFRVEDNEDKNDLTKLNKTDIFAETLAHATEFAPHGTLVQENRK